MSKEIWTWNLRGINSFLARGIILDSFHRLSRFLIDEGISPSSAREFLIDIDANDSVINKFISYYEPIYEREIKS